MKKLLGIVVLGLLFNTNVFAKIVTLEKCYENTYKQEFIQTIKGIPEDPSIREYGPNDESWSKKSYEDYMNNIIVASEKNKKTFDPFAEKKQKNLKRKMSSKLLLIPKQEYYRL